MCSTDYDIDSNQQASGRDQLYSYKVYDQNDSSRVKFVAYQYSDYLGGLSRMVEMSYDGTDTWTKKITALRHLAGTMPRVPARRDWLRGVIQQEWHKTLDRAVPRQGQAGNNNPGKSNGHSTTLFWSRPKRGRHTWNRWQTPDRQY